MGGFWPGHRGYTSTLYEKCHGIFNDHRESIIVVPLDFRIETQFIFYRILSSMMPFEAKCRRLIKQNMYKNCYDFSTFKA